jgi:multiple sugar transport system permease protein
MLRKPPVHILLLRWVLLALVILWSTIPIALVVLSSFKLPSRIFEFPPRFIFWPNLGNYHDLYRLWPEFFPTLGNSLIVTAGAGLLTLLVSVPAAYAYSRYRSPALTFSAFLMLAIRMFPPIVITLPLYPVIRQLGLNDTHIVLVVLYSTFFVSLSTWVMKAFIDEIPRELDESAKLDGCNVLQLLTWIILPLSRHGIVATVVFVVVFSWKEFLFAFLFTSSVARTAPAVISEMLGSVTGVQWGPLLAAATLQLMPLLVFVLLIQRFLVKGLTAGSTKG